MHYDNLILVQAKVVATSTSSAVGGGKNLAPSVSVCPPWPSLQCSVTPGAH